MLKSVPGIYDLADLQTETILNLSSTDITMADWLNLAKRIAEADDSDVDGIVITHGTDTLDELAYFLTLTSITVKPIVITGSMRPATATSADGPLNLYQAVLTAASDQSIGKGALIVFQDAIYAARDCQKISTFKVDAFKSNDFGCLGYIRDDQIFYLNQSVKRHTFNSEFNLKDLNELPRVPVIYYSQDADPGIIEYVAEKSDGFVIAGAGGSSFSKSWRTALFEVTNQGVIVIRSTRTSSGITIYDQVMDGESGTLPSYTLAPQKARILLMLALTKTKNKNEIDRIFREY